MTGQKAPTDKSTGGAPARRDRRFRCRRRGNSWWSITHSAEEGRLPNGYRGTSAFRRDQRNCACNFARLILLIAPGLRRR
jgi:hypothetical protein